MNRSADSLLRERPAQRGAVAVVCRQGRLLVIRRSRFVRAPGAYCFPGGGIELGEDEPTALVRELNEELGVWVSPVRRLWESTTPWGVALAWWHAELAEDHQPVPNPAEVASVHWHTPAEMRGLAELLPSNLEFLDAWQRGEFRLPINEARSGGGQ